MPHRKKPYEYAYNLLRQYGKYDDEKQEHINQISPKTFRDKIKEKYPTVNVDKVIQHLPTNSLIDGLVLEDPRGCGALQHEETVPKGLSCEEWNEQMYLSIIYNKNKHNKHIINNNKSKRRRVF